MRFVVAIVGVLNIGLVAQAPDTLDLTQRGVKSEAGTREDKPATGSGLGISSHATREPMRVALELADLDRGSYEVLIPSCSGSSCETPVRSQLSFLGSRTRAAS